MSNHSESAPSSRYIKVAAIAFAIAFGLHGADHLLRGMATSPMPVMVGGLIQGIFVVVAVALILRERPLALPGRHLRGASAAPRCSCTRTCCRRLWPAIRTASSPDRGLATPVCDRHGRAWRYAERLRSTAAQR